MSNTAIQYELGLVVAGTIAFAVWQWWELKRDGELLRQRRELEREQAREQQPVNELYREHDQAQAAPVAASTEPTLKPPSAS